MLIAIDGRQGGGKTMTARRLAQAAEESFVVHSDDVAWWESFFGWGPLMAEGILDPLRRGASVDYRPPAWRTRGRDGSIVVPGSARLVFIEGAGTSRRSLAPLLDAVVWVQSDKEEADRRGIERDGGGQAEADFWWAWDAEEQPFFAEDRPWERADFIVCGTPEQTGIEHDPARELLVGRPFRPWPRATA